MLLHLPVKDVVAARPELCAADAQPKYGGCSWQEAAVAGRSATVLLDLLVTNAGRLVIQT